MMKKWLIVILLVMVVGTVSAGDYMNELTRGLADNLYCALNGDCTLSTLTVDNLTVNINWTNQTVTTLNYNVTGNVTATGEICDGYGNCMHLDDFVNITGDNMTGDLYITNNGKLGIGTTTPSHLLDVHSKGSDAVINISTNRSKNAVVWINTPNGSWQIQNDGDASLAGAGDLVIRDSLFGKTSMIFQKSTGRVGMGTKYPFSNIHILAPSTQGPTSLLYLEHQRTGIYGGRMILMHNTSSPADGDSPVIIEFKGTNDNNQKVDYGEIHINASDVSDTTEDSLMAFLTMEGGTQVTPMILEGNDVYLNGYICNQTGYCLHNATGGTGGGENLQETYDIDGASSIISVAGDKFGGGLMIKQNNSDSTSVVRFIINSTESAPATNSEAWVKFHAPEPGSGGEHGFLLCVGDGLCEYNSSSNVLAASWDKPQVGVPENIYPASIRSVNWIPFDDATTDLGASDYRWRNLYLSGTILGTGSGESIYFNASTGDARFNFQHVNMTQNGSVEVSGNFSGEKFCNKDDECFSMDKRDEGNNTVVLSWRFS